MALLLLKITESGVEVFDLTSEADDRLAVRIVHFQEPKEQLVDQRKLVLHTLERLGADRAELLKAGLDVKKERNPFRRLADFLLNFIRKPHA